MTATSPCAPLGRPVTEPAEVRENRVKILRAYVARALFAGPKTVRELAAQLEPVPAMTPKPCGPGCGGHTAHLVWRQPTEAEVRRVLCRLETEGRAGRFIGNWAQHLWSLNAPIPARPEDTRHRV